MPETKTEIQNIVAGTASADAIDIRRLVYVIRGAQVMLDSDLAMLYQVETGALNRAVKRNIGRFPDDFRFQLSKEELENLKCQIGIASSPSNGYGGRRTMPFAYTEQGISMLASVLHSEVAVQMSISIMRTFVELRRFYANNAALFDRISSVELRQLEYQRQTNEKFNQVFAYIGEHTESSEKLFFDGQIYDAHSFLISLIQKASTNIILIDGYVTTETLDMLSKKNAGVTVTIITYPGAQLSKNDIQLFNAQYPTLTVKRDASFHDRFLILDSKSVYHIGASLKDAGKKCFGLSLIDDWQIVSQLLSRINSIH